jgi:hypothetical protein
MKECIYKPKNISEFKKDDKDDKLATTIYIASTIGTLGNALINEHARIVHYRCKQHKTNWSD